MKIRYWDVIPGKGDGVCERNIDFDPNVHATAEGAARAFHAALVKFVTEAGPDDGWFGSDPAREISLWSPGERTDMTEDPDAWAICWEGGPWEWAYHTHAIGTEGYRSCPGPWSFMLCFYPCDERPVIAA